MRLWAISDLHVSMTANRQALDRLPAHPDDGLILAGDIGERPEDLGAVFDTISKRFRQLFWVPGNHELWTVTKPEGVLEGQRKYEAMRQVARAHGVVTPDDPYPVWDGGSEPLLLVPMFLLYDYSFRPDAVPLDGVLAWSWEHRLRSADERRLSPAPFASRQEWCAARVAATEARLRQERPAGMRTILINHFPLRADLVTLRRIPRFSPWCGTTATTDWHRQFDAAVCVHGHLHVPATHWRDGVRFEEVSLGYPRQWQPHDRGPERALRQIWPPPPLAGPDSVWHR